MEIIARFGRFDDLSSNLGMICTPARLVKISMLISLITSGFRMMMLILTASSMHAWEPQIVGSTTWIESNPIESDCRISLVSFHKLVLLQLRGCKERRTPTPSLTSFTEYELHSFPHNWNEYCVVPHNVRNLASSALMEDVHIILMPVLNREKRSWSIIYRHVVLLRGRTHERLQQPK